MSLKSEEEEEEDNLYGDGDGHGHGHGGSPPSIVVSRKQTSTARKCEKTRENGRENEGVFLVFLAKRASFFHLSERGKRQRNVFIFKFKLRERERENKAGFSGFQAVNDAARAKSLG